LFSLGLSDFGLFSSLSLDFFEGETNDTLLDLDVSSLLLFGEFFSLDLLVKSSPGGGPSDSLGLNLGQPQLSALLGDEGVGLAVLGDELVTTARVNFVFGE